MTKLGPGSRAGQYQRKPSIWWDSDNNSLFLFHENREVGLGGTRLPQCLIMKRKIHGMRTTTNRWIRYGILIVGVQKDSRAFTPRLWTRLLSSRNRATNCVRAKKLENRLSFFFIGHGAHAIIATTHSFDANKGNYSDSCKNKISNKGYKRLY